MKVIVIFTAILGCCLGAAAAAQDVVGKQNSAAAGSQTTFAEYLQKVKQQAGTLGIGSDTLMLLDSLEFDSRMIAFDRKQPEFTQTFEQYLSSRVTQYRIKAAQKHYRQHSFILEKIADQYQVDAEYLLAFWGMESNFGKYQGKYYILRSLASLGYDPRRAGFFTEQLLQALKILDEGHISADKFVGGWAGAMGQNQFMPSSFLAYAQDFDGDGKKNIWRNQADVWASIAYYLQQNGWQQHEPWGMQVTLGQDLDFVSLKPALQPKGCRAYKYHTVPLGLADWQVRGVILPMKAPGGDQRYAMVVPEIGQKSAYLIGPNFKAILSYNCANKYAVSIGLLADKVLPAEQ